jgi:hypothetical protein
MSCSSYPGFNCPNSKQRPQIMQFQDSHSHYNFVLISQESDYFTTKISCCRSIPFTLHKSYFSSDRPVKPVTDLITAFPFQSGKINSNFIVKFHRPNGGYRIRLMDIEPVTDR